MEIINELCLQNVSLSVGEGRHRVEITAVLTGDGVSVLITGGERPHVGAVVMCVPRNSLSGEGISCDSWILPVPGHKDTEAAQPVAEMICRALGQTTVVTAGIHIDKAVGWELELLLDNCLTAARQLVHQLTDALEAGSCG
jgi:hypothetical protein